jgi:hypothetical protein
LDNIVEVKTAGSFGGSFSGGYEVLHNSPEIKNPVCLPDRNLALKLENLMNRH